MPSVRTPTLEITYLDDGPATGPTVVLLHGFPYDIHAYDEVVPPLVDAGCRTIVPYLRGYGATRFLSDQTPRSGQQAALGKDLLDLLDALSIDRATLVGYDWGGRAACIVAALWPERAAGLVSATGYNIQNIAASSTPAEPEQEYRYWYQYYFHTERGRAGLTTNRRGLCRLLWCLWSPTWSLDDSTYERTAQAFDNPDFVDVVIQSYRHRYGYAPGDPALEPIEQQLARQPDITVPTINLHGADDGVTPYSQVDDQAGHFTSTYERRAIPGVGHNVPQEAPAAVVHAVLDLVR
ncbi:MAG: alpha/beta hydrolase [Chloroflexi bacterium]|nr:alpha/beta hydrolase [Chloroflexota bacterium]